MVDYAMKRRWFLASILPASAVGYFLGCPSQADKSIPRSMHSSFAPDYREVFLPDTKANRALYAALSKNSLAGVKQAFTQGASADAKLTWKTEGSSPETQQASSPFITQVKSWKYDAADKPQAIAIFREFLKHNPDIHATDAGGVSAIHAATLLGDIRLVKEVLVRGAKVNAATEMWGTPLMIATGNIEPGQEDSVIPLIQLLLEHGASPNVFGGRGGFTPLMKSVLYGHTKIVTILLQYGADPTLKNKAMAHEGERSVDRKSVV